MRRIHVWFAADRLPPTPRLNWPCRARTASLRSSRVKAVRNSPSWAISRDASAGASTDCSDVAVTTSSPRRGDRMLSNSASMAALNLSLSSRIPRKLSSSRGDSSTGRRSRFPDAVRTGPNDSPRLRPPLAAAAPAPAEAPAPAAGCGRAGSAVNTPARSPAASNGASRPPAAMTPPSASPATTLDSWTWLDGVRRGAAPDAAAAPWPDARVVGPKKPL